MSFVWINGQFVEESSASVSVRDTGLLHAIGVFTTMRATRGRVVRLPFHLKRLRDSCEALFVPLQYKDDALETAIAELLQRNDLPEARLRLTITRGSSTNDPLHGLRVEPTALLTASPFEPYPSEYYEKGLTAIVLDDQKLNPYDIQAGHKTLDYFSRLTALREANRRGAGEAFWFNVHNYLQSGSISNVFVVKNSTVYTPPTNEELRAPSLKAAIPYPRSNVLPGTTRGAIVDLCLKENIDVRLGALTINELVDADEVFITNSVMGVMPVCRVERKAIGKEKPGEITRRLGAKLDAD